jgi:hypothetical protein
MNRRCTMAALGSTASAMLCEAMQGSGAGHRGEAQLGHAGTRPRLKYARSVKLPWRARQERAAAAPCIAASLLLCGRTQMGEPAGRRLAGVDWVGPTGLAQMR